MQILVVLLFISLNFASYANQEKRYPYVSYIENHVDATDDDGKVSKVEKNQIFRVKVHLTSDKNSKLTLQLAPKATVYLYGPFDLNIPGINTEDGKVELLVLASGKLKYICEGLCQHVIATPLSKMTMPQSSVMFSYYPNIPMVNLKVVKGQMMFTGLENEASVELISGQEASFVGVLEDSKPAYDVLLKGKKVARGKLSAAKQIDEADLIEFHRIFALQNKTKVKARPKPGMICQKPEAKFNQCQYKCEKFMRNSCQSCVRLRCSAEGEWSDRRELFGVENICTKKEIIKSCD